MNKSFTLIELAVVIGITLLLVSGVVMGLSTGRQEREVKTTAERVRTMILEARSRAMNPDENAKGLDYVEVRIANDQPNKVSIVEIYKGIPTFIQEYLPPKIVKITTPDGSFLGGGGYKYCIIRTQNSEDIVGIGKDIGVIAFNNDTPLNTHIITVSDASGTTKYDLKIFGLTGNVEIEAQ